jgi:hypothetical protein
MEDGFLPFSVRAVTIDEGELDKIDSVLSYSSSLRMAVRLVLREAAFSASAKPFHSNSLFYEVPQKQLGRNQITSLCSKNATIGRRQWEKLLSERWPADGSRSKRGKPTNVKRNLEDEKTGLCS